MRRDILLSLRAVAIAVFAISCAPPATPSEPGPPAVVVEYVKQQEILTPLPLRVRLPERYGAENVLVFFHTWGSRNWGVLELERAGQTWMGEVSCREVSTVTGDTRYFFLALDAKGDVVVGSGSPDWPHVATIVGSLPDGPETLRGEHKPVRCHDPADCPPDFPGCPAYTILRPRCGDDGDCSHGGRCAWDGYCDAAPERDVNVYIDVNASDEDRLAAAVRAATRRFKTARTSNRRLSIYP